jgi:hypothetical protein
MNINSAISYGSKILKKKSIPSSQLDSEILMSKTINKDREYINSTSRYWDNYWKCYKINKAQKQN